MKTLKDLKWHSYLIQGLYEEKEAKCINPNELRQAAIEWVKKMTFSIEHNGAEMPKELCPFDHITDWRSHIYSIIRWIINFFNLTQEDLK